MLSYKSLPTKYNSRQMTFDTQIGRAANIISEP